MRIAILLLLTLSGSAHSQTFESKASIYARPSTHPAAAASAPITLTSGPHLLIDDQLIESSHNIRRVVIRPSRDTGHANPIITRQRGRLLSTVHVDPARRGDWPVPRLVRAPADADQPTASRLAYMESDDGIAWQRPHRLLDTPAIQFGASVLHDRDGYKFAWWAPAVPKDAPPGMKLASSPDGLHWTQVTTPGAANDVVLGTTTTSTASSATRSAIGTSPSPARTWKTPRGPASTASPPRPSATTCFTGPIRGGSSCPTRSWSTTRPSSTPWTVFLRGRPVDRHGESTARRSARRRSAQSARCVRHRLHNACVDPRRRALDPRSRTVPRPRSAKGAWDHAHAWIDEQLPVGDDVYLYYAGYCARPQGQPVRRAADRIAQDEA